jgi:alkanesulfonate monooxygenase SsuD/methylene tetrahydromethanopterin reductase-like flavin-dependent oxidoreductase (luciferase family)
MLRMLYSWHPAKVEEQHMADRKLFRFGVMGVSAHSRKAWVAKAQRAEALGFSTFLVSDHFNDQLAPLPALLAAAGATAALRIATGK